MYSRIIGSGSYLPHNELDNSELVKFVDSNEEWIRTRTGILKRHIAEKDEPTSRLGYNAALHAIKDAGIENSEIDLIIVATTTPDNTFPSTASKIQHMLGIKEVAAFDLQAVCSGFIFGLDIVEAYMKSKKYNKILLIGSEKMSNLLDWSDRTTSILFGDGASAFIIESTDSKNQGIIDTIIRSDGSYYDMLKTDGGPGTNKLAGKIIMNGREVFKHAVNNMIEISKEILEKNNLTIDDVDYMIPHQANMRIISSVIERMGINEDKVVKTVDKHANCSAASVPLAFDEVRKKGKLKKGSLVLCVAMGAGFSWGASLIKI